MSFLDEYVDLAPQIFRQRHLYEGKFQREVDPRIIREFFSNSLETLELRGHGEPIVYCSLGKGTYELEGYEAFQPMIDSGIMINAYVNINFLDVLVSTCKPFDTDEMRELIRSHFRVTEIIDGPLLIGRS